MYHYMYILGDKCNAGSRKSGSCMLAHAAVQSFATLFPDCNVDCGDCQSHLHKLTVTSDAYSVAASSLDGMIGCSRLL